MAKHTLPLPCLFLRGLLSLEFVSFEDGSGEGGSLAVLGTPRCVHWGSADLQHDAEFNSSDRSNRNNRWRTSHKLGQEGLTQICDGQLVLEIEPSE